MQNADDIDEEDLFNDEVSEMEYGLDGEGFKLRAEVVDLSARDSQNDLFDSSLLHRIFQLVAEYNFYNIGVDDLPCRELMSRE